MDNETIGKRAIKSQRSKKNLLEAAARLFSERGIDKVGVREISAAAGVTTGTFYHYFTGKDDILDKLYLNHDEQFGQILHRLSEQEPYCDGIVHFFSENLVNMVEEDGVDFTRHRMFQMQKHSTEENQLYSGVIQLIQKAIAHGELPHANDPASVNGYLFTVFRGILYEWCIVADEERFSLKEAMRPAIHCALRAFQ